MEKNEKKKIISKYIYNFVIEHNKNNYIESIELILENYSNESIIITLYQFNDDSISKYSNIFPVDYFTNQSTIIKCLLLISKNNDKCIEKILNIIKTQLNNDKNNNNKYLIYNEKKLSFKIKKSINNNNESINFILYITLINLQKEKLILNIKKDKVYNSSNANIPNLFNIYQI